MQLSNILWQCTQADNPSLSWCGNWWPQCGQLYIILMYAAQQKSLLEISQQAFRQPKPRPYFSVVVVVLVVVIGRIDAILVLEGLIQIQLFVFVFFVVV